MNDEKIVSFPHIGDYSYFVKPLIKNITNLKVQVAPPITKKNCRNWKQIFTRLCMFTL